MGISGTKQKRPELDGLMSDAHKRRFDAVVVWKFDRFARSVSHLLRALETFRAQGIEFVSFSEQLDTSTPAGKMVFTVLGAVAELERGLIQDWRRFRPNSEPSACWPVMERDRERNGLDQRDGTKGLLRPERASELAQKTSSVDLGRRSRGPIMNSLELLALLLVETCDETLRQGTFYKIF